MAGENVYPVMEVGVGKIRVAIRGRRPLRSDDRVYGYSDDAYDYAGAKVTTRGSAIISGGGVSANVVKNLDSEVIKATVTPGLWQIVRRGFIKQ